LSHGDARLWARRNHEETLHDLPATARVIASSRHVGKMVPTV